MRPSRSTLLSLLASFVGCGVSAEPPLGTDATADARDAVMLRDAGDRDAADVTSADTPTPMDARAPADAANDSGPRADTAVIIDAPNGPDVAPPPVSGLAPPGVRPNAPDARGSQTLDLPAEADVTLRFDAAPDEHVGLRLDFTPPTAAVVLSVDRWDGARPVELWRTDGGAGLRVLAVFDPRGRRTFWARIRSAVTLGGARLTVVRTPFTDGPRCEGDCARLLQLPLRIDRAEDGYDHTPSTIMRYQFGRRDLVMFIRWAGRQMASQGRRHFVPEDLSQWDGDIPGRDRGALRHASHQRGKDVDLSLYGADGEAPWRSYCTARAGSDGRECVAGTARDYDGVANAALFAPFFATGRVTMCFLDRELIAVTRAALPRATAMGLVPSVALARYTDGSGLQHWPNHDNHIHLRVSEAAPGALVYEPFAPP